MEVIKNNRKKTFLLILFVMAFAQSCSSIPTITDYKLKQMNRQAPFPTTGIRQAYIHIEPSKTSK